MLKTYDNISIDYFQRHPILKNHITLFDQAKRVFSDKNNMLFIRVPGRVNLIGEHVDYNHGAVLPCARTLGRDTG